MNASKQNMFNSSNSKIRLNSSNSNFRTLNAPKENIFNCSTSSIQSMSGRIQPMRDHTLYSSSKQPTMPYFGGMVASSSSQNVFNRSFTMTQTNFNPLESNATKKEPMFVEPSLKSYGGVKTNWLSFQSSQTSLNNYKGEN